MFFESPHELAIFAAHLLDGIYAIAESCDAMNESGGIDDTKIPYSDRCVVNIGSEITDILARVMLEAVKSRDRQDAAG